jgi:hypothetical protein
MRKKLLWVLVILTCGLATAILTGCSSDDDKAEAKTEVTMMYYVKVTDDVLKVADVEVNYVDQTGTKKKEVLTSAEWKKTFSANALPLTEGLWAKITPKASIAEGSYQLNLTTAAGYQAKLPSGKTIADAFGNDPEAAPTAAQTADGVAVWCAKSPTVGFTVSQEGYAKQTKVDFGGNDDDDPDNGLATWLCEKFMKFWGYPLSYCARK